MKYLLTILLILLFGELFSQTIGINKYLRDSMISPNVHFLVFDSSHNGSWNRLATQNYANGHGGGGGGGQTLTISSPLTGGSYDGSTPVSIGITLSDATHNGYLSSTDWNTFNNKGIGTLTSLATNNGTGITGGTITTTGTLAIDTSNTISTLLQLQHRIDSLSLAIGPTIYTGDGGLAGDRTVDLNGHLFHISQLASDMLLLDPTLNSQQILIQAFGNTGAGNFGAATFNGTDTYGRFALYTLFNGVLGTEIDAQSDVTGKRIEYTADTHTFNGDVGAGVTPTADQQFIADDGIGDSLVLNKTSRTITLTAANGVIYNTPPSGASTDSIMTWDAATKTLRAVDPSVIAPNLVFNNVGAGQLTAFARNDSLFSKNVKDTGFIKWDTAPDSSLRAYLDTSSASLHSYIALYGGGGSGGLTIGTSTITSGTNGRVLYDNSGVLGEMTTTGSGTTIALATSPVLTSPTITTGITPTTDDGAALGTTSLEFSDLFLASGAVVNIANGNWVMTHTSGIETVGTGDLRITTAGTNTASVVTVGGTQTLSNKRNTKRVGSTTSSATPTINTDNVDIYELTAQTADITSFTTNLSGTPNDGDVLRIRITGTASRAITWGASFAAATVTLPTSTNGTNTLTTNFEWQANGANANKWVVANWY